jgi:hypothetical protein
MHGESIATPTPTTPSPTPTPKDNGPDRPPQPAAGPTGHIGWIVAGSLATGLVAALLLVAAPFIRAEDRAVTGAVRVVDGATHEALVADEDHAAATTRAILDVVSSVRSAGRLAG